MIYDWKWNQRKMNNFLYVFFLFILLSLNRFQISFIHQFSINLNIYFIFMILITTWFGKSLENYEHPSILQSDGHKYIYISIIFLWYTPWNQFERGRGGLNQQSFNAYTHFWKECNLNDNGERWCDILRAVQSRLFNMDIITINDYYI